MDNIPDEQKNIDLTEIKEIAIDIFKCIDNIDN